MSGVPNLPTFAGLGDFTREIVHSSEFTSGARYRGRRAIVVGTGNSGHDIAQELYSNGAAAVSMVQRSPTCVVSLVPGATTLYELYAEGPPVEDVDLVFIAIPYPILEDSNKRITTKIRALDAKMLGKLRAASFETDFGPDNTGFYMKYLREGGGYYINVGCSELISEGRISVIQARNIVRFIPHGLAMQDGSQVEADLVVLATGYKNQQEGVRSLLGDEIADRVGPIWGFDENHIMRNMWQRTAQPCLWIMGGDLILCRIYSRFLAIQIVADLKGIDLAKPGFRAAPSHTSRRQC